MKELSGAVFRFDSIYTQRAFADRGISQAPLEIATHNCLLLLTLIVSMYKSFSDVKASSTASVMLASIYNIVQAQQSDSSESLSMLPPSIPSYSSSSSSSPATPSKQVPQEHIVPSIPEPQPSIFSTSCENISLT